jgi:hypothetical protein
MGGSWLMLYAQHQEHTLNKAFVMWRLENCKCKKTHIKKNGAKLNRAIEMRVAIKEGLGLSNEGIALRTNRNIVECRRIF